MYRRPFDPDFPVVCMDETPRQPIGETRETLPTKPGRPARHDYEYRRCVQNSYALDGDSCRT